MRERVMWLFVSAAIFAGGFVLGGYNSILVVAQEKQPVATVAPEITKEKPGPPYTPTELQKVKLENAQLRMGIAQRDFATAQRAWNEAAGAFRTECDAIKKENAWPDDLTCDMQTLKFTEKEKPAPPKITEPAKKP